jgi:hypothetical protein
MKLRVSWTLAGLPGFWNRRGRLHYALLTLFRSRKLTYKKALPSFAYDFFRAANSAGLTPGSLRRLPSGLKV